MREIKFYNSLTNSLEVFKPIQEGEISIYVCGPTVYNHPHIGNARPNVVFDVLVKFLRYVGYKVTHMSNLTDVDDKIINEAIKEGLNSICTSIKMILEKTPPELAKDIIRSGIYLAGGSSQLKHMGDLITSLTNIKVNETEEPALCVVRGLNHIVTEPQYQTLAYNLKKRIYN